jgi:dephospho-CoA kinase
MHESMTVPVVGLTGGIASGKSTVARYFAALGVPTVDADQLAREVVLPGTPGLKDIVEVFGAEVLQADGTLDRKALGQRVFHDAAARAKLNAITHPRIAALASERMRALAGSGAPYTLYEAALIVENGLHRAMHGLIVVSADVTTQLARLMQRDNMAHADAHARVQAQAPLAHKLAVADFVIDNSEAHHDSLPSRVQAVHEALITRLGGTRP